MGVTPANVLIGLVSPKSPAARGGLSKGDLIVAVDGDPVGSFAFFSQTVRASEGRPLLLAYARDGIVSEVSIAPKLDVRRRSRSASMS